MEDDVVGGDRGHAAVLHRLYTRRVDIQQQNLGLGVVGGKVLGWGRTLDSADVLAVKVGGRLDGRVVLLHEDRLPRLVVGLTEFDLRLALGVDREGGDHDVHLVFLEKGDAVLGDRLFELDLVFGKSERLAQFLGDRDVESVQFAADGILHTEAGLIELDAKGDLLGGDDLAHGGVRGERRHGRLGGG